MAFWWKRPVGLGEIFRQIDWSYLVYIIPLVGLDYFLGGFRFKVFFEGKYLTKVSLWDCIRSYLANMFMGAVTPMQTGGGPAQVYILWRAGTKVSEGTLISVINYFATLIFFLSASFGAIFLLPPNLLGEDLSALLRIAYIGLVALILIVLFILSFPRITLILVSGFFRLIPVRSEKLNNIRVRMSNSIESGTRQFKSSLREILRFRKGVLGIAAVLALLLYLNKFIIGYFIACMLWENVPFTTFIALQIIQFFLIYFAPTPGASGVAEVSSTLLIAYILPAGLALVYTVIWRALTMFLGAIFGGFILIGDMRRLQNEKMS